MNFSYADKSSSMPESTNSEEEAASHPSHEDKHGDKKAAAADPSVSLFFTRIFLPSACFNAAIMICVHVELK